MKKGTKKVLITVGVIAGVLIGVPIIMNAIRPKGMVNPMVGDSYPDELSVGPSRVPLSSAPSGQRIVL